MATHSYGMRPIMWAGAWGLALAITACGTPPSGPRASAPVLETRAGAGSTEGGPSAPLITENQDPLASQLKTCAELREKRFNIAMSSRPRSSSGWA